MVLLQFLIEVHLNVAECREKESIFISFQQTVCALCGLKAFLLTLTIMPAIINS